MFQKLRQRAPFQYKLLNETSKHHVILTFLVFHLRKTGCFYWNRRVSRAWHVHAAEFAGLKGPRLLAVNELWFVSTEAILGDFGVPLIWNNSWCVCTRSHYPWHIFNNQFFSCLNIKPFPTIKHYTEGGHWIFSTKKKRKLKILCYCLEKREAAL